VPDLEISKLPALAGVNLQPTDPVALADLSASETKQITAKDLIQHGIALIDPGSIPASKVSGGVADGSITEPKLATGAVSARALADNSTAVVGTALPATGAYIGQLALETTTNKLYAWSGAGWVALKAAGSVNTVTTNNGTNPVQLAGVVSGDQVSLSATITPSTGGGLVLAGPAGGAGPVLLRKLDGLDLPLPTATTRGGVSINGFGLKLAGDRVEIDNAVTASSTFGVVTYNAQGLVTGGRAIGATDLPLATAASPGAVSVGTQFGVLTGGVLVHSNSVTAGTASKVTFDAQGHITGTQSLTPADIPDLDAAKLTSGQLPTARLADQSVTAQKLADYAIALIQESVPVAGVGSHPIGMTWLQESTGQVSIWNGNSWMKTGASTLFNRNLRYCGTYNPGTGVINGVTQFGTADGFKVGDTIPAADDKHAGVYFVATTGGTSASIAGGATFDAGDWLLCQGTTGGWVRIDTLSGAGAGGGVGGGTDHLDGLLDVTLTNPKPGDVLHFTAAGQWVNVAFTDAGTY
jgi:hypothetical protein